MYDVMVFDHRLAEYRPLDSKAELARLLFGYTTGNGQRFPAQPELVRFVVRPGKDSDEQADLTGREAIAHAEEGETIRWASEGPVRGRLQAGGDPAGNLSHLTGGGHPNAVAVLPPPVGSRGTAAHRGPCSGVPPWSCGRPWRAHASSRRARPCPWPW